MSTDKKDYGWYAPQDFEEYMNNMIGDFRSELEKMFFTDRRKTSYLQAIEYNADIIWHEYNVRQNKDPKLALVNTDALNDALLSLHPTSLIKKKKISTRSKKALPEVHKFKDLILLKDYSKMAAWLKVANSINYFAQICIMGWFRTLISKITGFNIS